MTTHVVTAVYSEVLTSLKLINLMYYSLCWEMEVQHGMCKSQCFWFWPIFTAKYPEASIVADHVKRVINWIACPHTPKSCFLFHDDSFPVIYCKQGALAVKTAQNVLQIKETEKLPTREGPESLKVNNQQTVKYWGFALQLNLHNPVLIWIFAWLIILI